MNALVGLRARVALATAVAVALAVAVAGVVIVGRFADSQWSALDEVLRERSDFVAGIVESASAIDSDELREAASAGIDRGEVEGGVNARLILPNGSTQTVGGFPADIGPLGDGTTTVRSSSGTEWRIATQTVPGPGRFAFATVSIAEPTAPAADAIAEVRALVVQAGVLAVVLAAGAGWLLGGLALAPIRRLRADAAGLALEPELSARIRPVTSPVEVASLVGSLNLLLGRLEDSDAERRRALERARAFAADAAHELRNPLTAMRADLDLLRAGSILDETETVEVLDELGELQLRIERTLEALRVLALSELGEVPERSRVDLAVLAAQALDAHVDDPLVSSELRSRVDDSTVVAWPEGLEIALRNVVENAVRHGADLDGRVHVEVDVDGGTDMVVVTVADGGPGVPVEERERVLARFERGRTPGGEGSGLGLAIADQQLRLQGGSVRLGDREGGHGTVVTIEVPREPAAPR